MFKNLIINDKSQKYDLFNQGNNPFSFVTQANSSCITFLWNNMLYNWCIDIFGFNVLAPTFIIVVRCFNQNVFWFFQFFRYNFFSNCQFFQIPSQFRKDNWNNFWMDYHLDMYSPVSFLKMNWETLPKIKSIQTL